MKYLNGLKPIIAAMDTLLELHKMQNNLIGVEEEIYCDEDAENCRLISTLTLEEKAELMEFVEYQAHCVNLITGCITVIDEIKHKNPSMSRAIH